jgi:hypothetical protein
VVLDACCAPTYRQEARELGVLLGQIVQNIDGIAVCNGILRINLHLIHLYMVPFKQSIAINITPKPDRRCEHTLSRIMSPMHGSGASGGMSNRTRSACTKRALMARIVELCEKIVRSYVPTNQPCNQYSGARSTNSQLQSSLHQDCSCKSYLMFTNDWLAFVNCLFQWVLIDCFQQLQASAIGLLGCQNLIQYLGSSTCIM